LKTELKETLFKNGQRLVRLWNGYAEARYGNIYKVRIQAEHRKTLIGLFLPIDDDSIVLDIGCGDGNMFPYISQLIRPKTVWAMDWSEKMLEEAKLEAERVQAISNTNFELFCCDISQPLDCLDESVDAILCNLVICYVASGWRKPLKEMARVLKPGGYLYLGTLLNTWSFKDLKLILHAVIEFLRHPIASFQGVKYRRIASEVAEESKRCGAEFPSRHELIDFLVSLGFKDITAIPTYWKGGIALRAKKSQTPFMA